MAEKGGESIIARAPFLRWARRYRGIINIIRKYDYGGARGKCQTLTTATPIKNQPKTIQPTTDMISAR